MKEYLDNKFENVDAINGIKYYYFGKTYFIDNSKMSLAKKKKNLLNILDEVKHDILLQNPALKATKITIEDIIYKKIDVVEFQIEVKKFKPIKINLFNIFCR